MSPPDFLQPATLRPLRRELEELYRMQAEQAARLAALEGEVFLLKRQRCELSTQAEHASRNSQGDYDSSQADPARPPVTLDENGLDRS